MRLIDEIVETIWENPAGYWYAVRSGTLYTYDSHAIYSVAVAEWSKLAQPGDGFSVNRFDTGYLVSRSGGLVSDRPITPAEFDEWRKM